MIGRRRPASASQANNQRSHISLKENLPALKAIATENRAMKTTIIAFMTTRSHDIVMGFLQEDSHASIDRCVRGMNNFTYTPIKTYA